MLRSLQENRKRILALHQMAMMNMSPGTIHGTAIISMEPADRSLAHHQEHLRQLQSQNLHPN
jgi:hypothetical protein